MNKYIDSTEKNTRARTGFGFGGDEFINRNSFKLLSQKLLELETVPFLWRQAAEEILLSLIRRRCVVLSVQIWDGWSNSDALPDDEEDKKNFGDGKFSINVETYAQEVESVHCAFAEIHTGVSSTFGESDNGFVSANFLALNVRDVSWSPFTDTEREDDKNARLRYWREKGAIA